MSARLLNADLDTLSSGNHSFRHLCGSLLRSTLRLFGVCLYHLGMADRIISLQPDRVRTFLYHAVENTPGSHTAGLDVTLSTSVFEQHLDYIQTHYRVISMQDLLRGRTPPCSALLTFDDGYRCLADTAVPALEARGMPATIYLIGKAVMGGMVWVNQLNHALNCHPQQTMQLLQSFPGLANVPAHSVIHQVQTHYPPLMIEHLMSQLNSLLPADKTGDSLFLTPEQIRSLQRRGISFGFHTNDHYNLELCNEQALRRQLDSREIDHLLDTRTFAYPFGYCGDREADRLEARGFQRTLLVQKETPHPRKSNMRRSEAKGNTAASVFAQLEVEEPVMRWLKSSLRSRLPATQTA